MDELAQAGLDNRTYSFIDTINLPPVDIYPENLVAMVRHAGRRDRADIAEAVNVDFHVSLSTSR